MLMSAIVIKVVFIYVDTKKLDYVKPSMRPTYGLIWEVSPDVRKPRVSAALSDVSKTGVIKPQVLIKTSK